MLKKCNNCGLDFHYKRTDQVYCGSKCKNSAANRRRKGIDIDPPHVETYPQNDVNTNNTRLNTFDETRIVQRIISALQDNKPKINGGSSGFDIIMNEKDYSKDISIQNAIMKTKMEYMDNQIKELVTTQNKMSAELEIYKRDAEENADGAIGKFIGACEKLNFNFSDLVTLFKSGGKSFPSVNGTQEPGKYDDPDSGVLSENELNELNIHLSDLQSLYPDKNINEILDLIKNGINNNKDLIDNFLMNNNG